MREKAERIGMILRAAREALMARIVDAVTEGARLLQVVSERVLQTVLDGRVKLPPIMLEPLTRFAGRQREGPAEFVCTPAGPDRPEGSSCRDGKPAVAEPHAASAPVPAGGAAETPSTPPSARKRRTRIARDRPSPKPRPGRKPAGGSSRARKPPRPGEPPAGGQPGTGEPVA